MKRLFILLLALMPAWVFPYSFDPGDLLNSAKRSLMITDVFLDRWDVMENSYEISELEKKDLQEMYYYVNRGGYAKNADIYFHVENISGYPVNDPVYGEIEDLSLFKVSASTIVKFDKIVDFGDGWEWGIAIGAVGYRYGMNKNVKMEGNSQFGADSQSMENKDYIYSQTYDDLIVLTNILKPLGYLHTGYIISKKTNSQLAGFGEKSETINRLFINSNLLGSVSFNFGYDSDRDTTDFFTTKLELTTLAEIFTKWVKRRYAWPDLFLGYSYFNAESKDIETEQGVTLYEKPSLHTMFLELFYSYYNAIYVKTRAELFLWGRDKREKEAGRAFKQAYLELGIGGKDIGKIGKNPKKFYKNKITSFSYYFIIGISFLADGRTMNYGNEKVDVIGYSVGGKMLFAKLLGGLTIEAKLNYNYSPKLYNLIESYDNWIAEFSVQLGF